MPRIDYFFAVTSCRPSKASLVAFILAVMICVSVLLPTQAFAESNPRYASIVMDADTGIILHQRYADKKLHPASLTKVMTLLMVFEALDRGKLRLNDRVRISEHAASMVPSKLDLPVGSSIRVQDAINALVTKSANDVAVALAEHIGGTEPIFAQMMTRKAQSIGMSQTLFRNASGLHDPAQITTARDMAKMARYVINNYPEYYRYYAQASFTYQGHTYRNHNRLMSSYDGMDGMKTGYIQASGFNLIASAVRNNRRVIGVVFGGRTAQSRNTHMASLLDTAFGKLNEIRVAGAQVPLPPRKPGILTAMAALDKAEQTAPALEDVQSGLQKWASVNTSFEDKFSALLGEGDYDPASRRRIETGLIAIAAYRGETTDALLQQNAPKQNVRTASYSPASWGVQIGAFESRAATDKALHRALKQIPGPYAAAANPVIAPLKTDEGWLFRARLGGFTKEDAEKLCGYLHECLPVALR
ncbi:MAG: D-alanyl-D-alanine carboxypeptidase [Alphaproteobacteria bacterium]|nr:D-alanyl-D-alanine carboxypeptidase [Alphaproteobacteria bacterium]